jgi:hypothetical protein
MSSGLAAIGQSVDELANGLGQMRRDITNVKTTEQALFYKISYRFHSYLNRFESLESLEF